LSASQEPIAAPVEYARIPGTVPPSGSQLAMSHHAKYQKADRTPESTAASLRLPAEVARVHHAARASWAAPRRTSHSCAAALEGVKWCLAGGLVGHEPSIAEWLNRG
jgi:hypothetical protein